MWRRLAETLGALTRGSSDAESARTAATLYDAYSVLLLYCGSCPPQIYADAIRPQMMRADPAFSGRWSRDFQPIEPMMQALRTIDAAPSLDELFTAAEENDRIHRSVAIRLVPGGRSLLGSSGREEDAPPTEDERDTYDAFFGVGHERLSLEESITALRQRLSAVRSDLIANPLPVPCGWEGLRHRDIALVDRFHRDSILILDDVEEGIDEST